MKCPKCNYEPTMAEMQRSPDDCVSCGVNYLGHARHVEQKRIEAEDKQAQLKLAPAVKAAMWDYSGAQPVVVVDVKMGFFSMVVFMVKWVLASIPAAIILAMIMGLAYALVSAIPSFMYYKEKAESQQRKSVLHEDKNSSVGVQISVPDGAGIDYFDAGRVFSDSVAVLTVRAVGVGGQVKYSKIGVDCRTGLAVVTGQADTKDQVAAYGMPNNYETVMAGTTRWFIAKYACAGADHLTSLLK